MSIWTHELLDALRLVGDPLLDGKTAGKERWRKVPVRAACELPGEHPDVALLRTWRAADTGAVPEEGTDGDPYWMPELPPLDGVQLDIAQDLFVVYGGEIGAALLLASLPNAYAAEQGAGVLAETGALRSDARRRIGETAQLVVDVLFPDSEVLYGPIEAGAAGHTRSLSPQGRAFVTVRTTRLTHAVIRSLVRDLMPDPTAPSKVPLRKQTPVGVPINQEDLLGTLGTFTVTVFEVMDRLGVPWTDEAELAYFTLWDRVGELLGIGTPEAVEALADQGVTVPLEYREALRPKSPAEARELQDLIRERCWPVAQPGRELGPFANASGKLLVRALLDQLQESMPRGMERLPLVVMRYLVHPAAHELLGLGGGGVPDSLLRWPSEARFTRRAQRQRGRRLVESSMRLAANEVSRRAFVHFIRSRADLEPKAHERKLRQLAAVDGVPEGTPFRFPGIGADHVRMPGGRGGS